MMDNKNMLSMGPSPPPPPPPLTSPSSSSIKDCSSAATEWSQQCRKLNYNAEMKTITWEKQKDNNNSKKQGRQLNLQVFERVVIPRSLPSYVYYNSDTRWLTFLPSLIANTNDNNNKKCHSNNNNNNNKTSSSSSPFTLPSYLSFANIDQHLQTAPRLYADYGETELSVNSILQRADYIEALWQLHGIRRTVIVSMEHSSLVTMELLHRQTERLVYQTPNNHLYPRIEHVLCVDGVYSVFGHDPDAANALIGQSNAVHSPTRITQEDSTSVVSRSWCPSWRSSPRVSRAATAATKPTKKQIVGVPIGEDSSLEKQDVNDESSVTSSSTLKTTSTLASPTTTKSYLRLCSSFSSSPGATTPNDSKKSSSSPSIFSLSLTKKQNNNVVATTTKRLSRIFKEHAQNAKRWDFVNIFYLTRAEHVTFSLVGFESNEFMMEQMAVIKQQLFQNNDLYDSTARSELYLHELPKEIEKEQRGPERIADLIDSMATAPCYQQLVEKN